MPWPTDTALLLRGVDGSNGASLLCLKRGESYTTNLKDNSYLSGIENKSQNMANKKKMEPIDYMRISIEEMKKSVQVSKMFITAISFLFFFIYL